MLFTLACHDKPGSLAIRQQTRPAHLAYIEQQTDIKILLAGPMLDPAGQPMGSLFILDCASQAAAEAFAAADPYAAAGLFATTAITGFRVVVRDGSLA